VGLLDEFEVVMHFDWNFFGLVKILNSFKNFPKFSDKEIWFWVRKTLAQGQSHIYDSTRPDFLSIIRQVRFGFDN
jgi:hypothetical protein